MSDGEASAAVRPARATGQGLSTRLIVFARVPLLGQVKTRLAAGIGEAAALKAHRQLLAHALATAAAARAGSLELCIAGEDFAGECAALARAHGARLCMQAGEDLGARMGDALARALREGLLPVLIGCDAPALTTADLHAAFDALQRHDAVFAPAEDGGYALVGCRRPISEAFEGVGWGGPAVMAQTRDRLRAADIDWAELRTVWDVDDASGFERWKALPASTGRRGALSVAAAGVAALLAAAVPRGHSAAATAGPIAPFSVMPAGVPPAAPWRERRVSGVPPNQARIVVAEGGRHLRIDSAQSASAWAHPLADGAAASEFAWRWRADGFPAASRLGDREADDFAARVYLLFDYPIERVPLPQRLALRIAGAFHDESLPAATICYLLHAGEDPGMPVESPYSSRVRMIVARPRARAGAWYAERRDIRRDFADAFGREHGPGMPPLAAVVVGADSDQGGGSFRTWFGDLSLR